MSADQQFIFTPVNTRVEFVVHQGMIFLNSLIILNQADELSGFGEWVTRITEDITPKRIRQNEMMMRVLFPGFELETTPATFEALIAQIEGMDAEAARDRILESFVERINEYGLALDTTPAAMLADQAAFMEVVHALIARWRQVKGVEYDPAVFDEAYAYLLDPPRMQAFVASHMRFMWENGLKAEWERNLPVLQASADAFSQLDLDGLSPVEAARTVTGRDMSEHWKDMQQPSRIVFLPSAHIGPYLSWFVEGDTTYIVFGARVPEGMPAPSPALGRSELLVRLNALADDTRLQIIDLLVKHDEMCAQTIKDTLGLSQSSASRHLRQLTATGYISERRRDVAKCYTLNMDRFEDTLRALRQFVKQNP